MDIGGRIERLVEAARATVLPIHPLQIDVLKLIACVCMLIDHINTCLYDRASVWAWLIGRLAFPLFGLTFVLTLKAHKAMATAKRLFIWAICTQPVYALAFANTGFSPWWAGNILFSFAAVAYLVALSQAPSATTVAKGLAVFVVASIIQAPSSFGLTGVVWLFVLHRSLKSKPDSGAFWLAFSLVAFLMLNPGMSIANVLIAVLIAGIIAASRHLRFRAPFRVTHAPWSRDFYGGHLLAIVLSLAT